MTFESQPSPAQPIPTLPAQMASQLLHQPGTSSADTNSSGAFSASCLWGNPKDDDVQFVSEKPVKRQRTNENQPKIRIPHHGMMMLSAGAGASAVVPNIALTASQLPGSDPRTERRLSTGMVCLASDVHDKELNYALRGVSMPVLENFKLDQPFRKPRPPSASELSPKELPSTLPSEMLGSQRGEHTPGAFLLTSPQAEKPASALGLAKIPLDPNQTATLAEYIDSASSSCSKSTPMPPPPPPSHPMLMPCAPPQKQPCQVCSRLRHPAQLSGAQGIPMVNAALPPHFMPQLHCHPSYGQHLHPQMMTLSTGNMHQFGPNFTPVMMPVNTGSFVPLSSHPQHQPPPQATPLLHKGSEKGKQQTPERSIAAQSPQISQLKNSVTGSSATPGATMRPPASLIQPTYRKPSPNLIVDVAETCQQTFPFEEVAKRHNVPVDKVFDVFAAIIQVPLLRCPTDRRRPGKLATARIKDYNRAKKDLPCSNRDEGEGDRSAVADSTTIAQKLGPVEFPDGFTLDRTS
ncbi:hypothetical protein F4802DRAFT_610919 [Xylaria palmicola]|nr:hypothetical protein F4802DRAFT_610919 [Xylaria palmicola]